MTQMAYRALGRTGLAVSAVGFGTSQLRRVTETQAVDTLLRGFDLGVNIVHTAPDYEGADDLVANAVARTPKKVIVASNGYDVRGNATGRPRLFEKLFESTCRKLRADRLDLFGIASVEDREGFGQNVWGPGGMVDFLQRMKARGRLGATFATTHGKPEFVRKLIESGAFDAIMVAYNDLGFHALSLHPPANWHFEDVRRTRDELFPLCAERGVGLMVMLPFAGGLLCRSKAFAPQDELPDVQPPVSAAAVLRSILSHPQVSCVLPGTACVEEAEENALAGHAPLDVEPGARSALSERLKVLQSTLCSRCGDCEPRCSQRLPISWMFRAAEMSIVSTSPYETWEDVEYFRLHPAAVATCATCPDVTCACPAGIDIPQALTGLHERMLDHVRRGLVPPPPKKRPRPPGGWLFAARVIRREILAEMRPGQTYVCRLNVENRGLRTWRPTPARHRAAVRLRVTLVGRTVATPAVRHAVSPGTRCHFVFELTAPKERGSAHLRLELVRSRAGRTARAGLVLFSDDIPVREPRKITAPVPAPRTPPQRRTAPPRAPYGVQWLQHNLPRHWQADAMQSLFVLARNTGSRRWRADAPGGDCVDLVVQAGGAIVHMFRVPHDVAPNEEVTFHFSLDDVAWPASQTELSFNLVEQNVAWFEQCGVHSLTLTVNDCPSTAPHERRPSVEWLRHNLPPRWPQGSVQAVYVRARNTGPHAWSAGGELVVRENGREHMTVPLPRDVAPDEDVTFGFPLLVPLALSWTSQQSEWSFHLAGGDPLVVPVETGPAESDPAAEALQIGGLVCNGFHLPSRGVSRSRDGRLYPLFAKSASGCRVRDVEGNEWIDYVMGWGSALLGYARPEVSDAIRRALDSGSVLALPHALELEVAQLLCETVPCCETTLFGKNGSDVCTAAVRIARAHTCRAKILFSGYSGWQEPFAPVFEPRLSQPGHVPSAFRFATNDLAQVKALFDEHAGQVAAVIVEPAAQVEGVDGPVRDADPTFLRSLADLCRRNGALLIFDEIMTGFRHPGGSVQKATGVVPDLACFGKALTSAMPLSALVGRREVMNAANRIFYHPTFKGEAYSFAAAAASLRIYQTEDVPGQVAAFGLRLTEAVNEISKRVGIDGGMIGLPYRMVYRFNEPDPSLRTLMRTLLEQELLERGVLPFRGFFLPSTAHGETELQRTAEAFEAALRRVRDVRAADRFEDVLNIPPVV